MLRFPEVTVIILKQAGAIRSGCFWICAHRAGFSLSGSCLMLRKPVESLGEHRTGIPEQLGAAPSLFN